MHWVGVAPVGLQMQNSHVRDARSEPPNGCLCNMFLCKVVKPFPVALEILPNAWSCIAVHVGYVIL